jgi:O-antigen/teichoic acid export membrane protein
MSVRLPPDVVTTQAAPVGAAEAVLTPVQRGRLSDRVAGLRGSEALLRMFSTLVSAQFVTAFFGLAYWAAAARFLPADQVGFAATAVSSMILVSLFGTLGMSTHLIGDLRICHPADRRLRLYTGHAVSFVGGGILALSWALVAPLFGENFDAVGGSVPVVALFVLCAATQTLCDSFDGSVLGLQRGNVQLVRTVTASGAKLALIPLLPITGYRTGVALLATWFAGLVISLPASYGMLRLSLGNPLAVPTIPRALWLRGAIPSALRHHSLNVALASSGLLLPVVVAVTVPANDVAYFSTARFIFAAVAAVPFMLTVSLYASVASRPDLLRDKVRHTVPIGLGVSLVMFVVLVPGAPLLLKVFGGEYASEGAMALRLLVLAGIPMVIKDHYVVIRRTQDRMAPALVVVLVGTIAEILAAGIVGSIWGLNALCAAWLGVLVIEALVVMPVVRRTMIAPATPASTPPAASPTVDDPRTPASTPAA